MEEILKVRLPEERVREAFGVDIGDDIGYGVRRVELPLGDPLVAKLADTDRTWRAQGRNLFFGWEIRRIYTQSELNEAGLLQLQITAFFEPSGEGCGTVYDYSAACSICGAGRSLSSPLRLNYRKIPRSKEFAQSIAYDEWVVSSRLAEALEKYELTGVRLDPVEHVGRASAGGESWYQLVVTSPPVSVASSTSFGIHPFDPDENGEYRCPLGHVVGLNLLSELALVRETWDGSDAAITKEFVGRRIGVLVPQPLLVVSPRFYRMLCEERMRGWKVERALLIGEAQNQEHGTLAFDPEQ